jgi:DNA-binding XRE family transcriptional regulator
MLGRGRWYGVSDAHGARLRLARRARGLSQQQVAEMAGVSRQAISLWESGEHDPSLRVAFALARALGMTIEELFGPGERAEPVAARPVAPMGGEETRVTLAAVGNEYVALPLRGVTAGQGGFIAASGLTARAGSDRGRSSMVRPIGPLRPVLVVAGCDPALPLMEAPLGLLDPPVGFSWWPCPSREALRLAAAGLVHAAGTHLRGSGSAYNIDPAAETLPQGGQVIGFCSWQEGLALRPELTEGISGVADAARRGLRLVNREPGAEARSVLDRELAAAGIDASQFPGYDAQVTGHLEVAGGDRGGAGRRGDYQRARGPGL